MRKTYVDNIRWITVVLVVIYHVIYIFNGATVHGIIGPFSDNQPQDVFQYIVYPWFMLLLFTVSGMSARFELEKRSEKEFMKLRTRKLLVPSTIGVLVFGWVLGYYNMLMSDAFTSMEGSGTPMPVVFLIMAVSGTGALWYIQMLWLFSILLIPIRKVEKDRLYNLCSKVNVPILLCLTILIYGAAQILNTPVVVVYRFGIYGVGFFIGYFVLSHDEVMDRVEKSWLLLSIMAVIACVAFVLVFWGQPYPEHVVLDTLLCNVYAWLGTLGVFAFMKKWGGFENSFSKWMCRESWGIYVFHYLCIAVSAWYLHVFAPGMAPVLVYLLVGIAGFTGAVILYELISRIPVLRWCVLGIRKRG
ncbi:MAG: acyltransferase [Butyrivibrio sp.]|nr:acyltransferase [Butyrivibrio sp.]